MLKTPFLPSGAGGNPAFFTHPPPCMLMHALRAPRMAALESKDPEQLPGGAGSSAFPASPLPLRRHPVVPVFFRIRSMF